MAPVQPTDSDSLSLSGRAIFRAILRIGKIFPFSLLFTRYFSLVYPDCSRGVAADASKQAAAPQTGALNATRRFTMVKML